MTNKSCEAYRCEFAKLAEICMARSLPDGWTWRYMSPMELMDVRDGVEPEPCPANDRSWLLVNPALHRVAEINVVESNGNAYCNVIVKRWRTGDVDYYDTESVEYFTFDAHETTTVARMAEILAGVPEGIAL